MVKGDNSILELKHVSVGYTSSILDNINISLPQGSVTALLGRNGAGKSTLLRTICKEIKPLAGEILIKGVNIKKINNREFGKQLSIVTTSPIAAGALTVKQVVSIGRDPYTNISGRLAHEDKEIVREAMAKTHILKFEHRFVADLSDGERQKVMIARALAQNTPVVVLDEPFSFIDSASKVEMLAFFNKMAHEDNKTILFSSHDIGLSLRMSDNAIIIRHDNDVLCGRTDKMVDSKLLNSIFENPNVEFNTSMMEYIPKNL